MYLSQTNNNFSNKITGSSPYQWHCFGKNAMFMDYESEFATATVVYDTDTQLVYQAEIYPNGEDCPYRWTDKNFIDEFHNECNEKNVDKNIAYDDVKFITLDLEDDFLEKSKSIFNNLSFDKRIKVPLELTDDEIVRLSLMANEKDITLNKFIEELLTNMITKEMNESKELVLVETVSTFRMRYLVEVPLGKSDYALDTVTMNDAVEFSQSHIGENVVSHRVMSKEEALSLCDIDNDYAKNWDEEQKVNAFFTPWNK